MPTKTRPKEPRGLATKAEKTAAVEARQRTSDGDPDAATSELSRDGKPTSRRQLKDVCRRLDELLEAYGRIPKNERQLRASIIINAPLVDAEGKPVVEDRSWPPRFVTNENTIRRLREVIPDGVRIVADAAGTLALLDNAQLAELHAFAVPEPPCGDAARVRALVRVVASKVEDVETGAEKVGKQTARGRVGTRLPSLSDPDQRFLLLMMPGLNYGTTDRATFRMKPEQAKVHLESLVHAKLVDKRKPPRGRQATRRPYRLNDPRGIGARKTIAVMLGMNLPEEELPH